MAEKSESKKSAAVEPKEEGKPSTERSRAVDAAILTIEKQFGRGAIMKLGSRERLHHVDSGAGTTTSDHATTPRLQRRRQNLPSPRLGHRHQWFWPPSAMDRPGICQTLIRVLITDSGSPVSDWNHWPCTC